MANKLTDSKIQEMWEAWQEKQNLHYVKKKCKVAYQTVMRYRVKEKWDERFDKLQTRVHRKLDTETVNAKARHAKLGQFMQAKGTATLQAVPANEVDPRLAKDLIKDGVTIEREATGDVQEGVTIILQLPKGLDGL